MLSVDLFVWKNTGCNRLQPRQSTRTKPPFFSLFLMQFPSMFPSDILTPAPSHDCGLSSPSHSTARLKQGTEIRHIENLHVATNNRTTSPQVSRPLGVKRSDAGRGSAASLRLQSHHREHRLSVQRTHPPSPLQRSQGSERVTRGSA